MKTANEITLENIAHCAVSPLHSIYRFVLGSPNLTKIIDQVEARTATNEVHKNLIVAVNSAVVRSTETVLADAIYEAATREYEGYDRRI